MKRILIVLAFIGSSLIASGQGLYPTFTPYEMSSQMWNVSSVYFNTPTNSVISASALGKQIDTGVNATAIFFSVSTFKTGYVNADTFIVAPLSGQGDITFQTSLTKVTGTNPLISIQYQSSTDGIRWGSIGTDTVTLIAATQYTIKHTFSKRDKYYRTQTSGIASSTYAVICGYYYLKSQTIYLNSK